MAHGRHSQRGIPKAIGEAIVIISENRWWRVSFDDRHRIQREAVEAAPVSSWDGLRTAQP